MKVCIIQPKYSVQYEDSDSCFAAEMNLLDQCDPSMDIIVCPEMCDVPSLAKTKEEFEDAAASYHGLMMKKASEVAKRCNAVLFINGCDSSENGIRNTTFVFDRNGEVIGKYKKQHLTPGEVGKRKLDSDYTFEFSEPTVIEVEGIRYGFLTCYDFYFYEAFANIARQNVDVVIGCSHQRSDTHRAIEIMSQFLAYNTNAYVFRASVSMDETAEIGGGSMIVAPDGRILANMKSRVGIETVELDIKEKYYKPAGFGNPLSAHYEYIEKGRRPWKYRPGGSAIVRHDEIMKFPRVCAHRGFNTVAPENSMPAFGAAVAMGAEEIEFDLRVTKDGEIVSSHDSSLERISDGVGKISDYTLEELRGFDFGIKFGEEFKGMRILTFEEILKKFSCHCVMNIHLKRDCGKPEYLDKIVALIKKYDCQKYVYFMCGIDGILEMLQSRYPEFTRCCGAGDDPWHIVERAVKYGCMRVQLFKPYFDQNMIDMAHENGIICNVFFADTPEEAEKYLDMGIDVILTNDYNRISQTVNKREKYINY